MTVVLPQASDTLLSQTHSRLHRVLAVDSASPDQSILVNSSGNLICNYKLGVGIVPVYKFDVLNNSIANDTSDYVARFAGGADGTLGSMDIVFGVHPSATGANRYSYITSGDASGLRPLILNMSTAGTFGTVSLGTVGLPKAGDGITNVTAQMVMVNASGRGSLVIAGSTQAVLYLQDRGAGSNLKSMVLMTDGGYTKFSSVNDNDAAFNKDGMLVMDHNSGMSAFGITPDVNTRLYVYNSGLGLTGSVAGLSSKIDVTGPTGGTTYFARATTNQAFYTGTGTLNWLAGFVNSAGININTTTGATISTVYGGATALQLHGSGNAIGTGYGMDFQAPGIDASSTMTTYYAIHISNASLSGTLTYNYGIYIDNQIMGSSLNYAIYSAGGQSYHAGKLGLSGATTPSYELSLGGTGDKTIGMERHDGAGTAHNFIILASGAKAGETNTLGGGQYYYNGKGTGLTDGLNIAFQWLTYDPTTSGSTDQTASAKVTILGNGNYGFGIATPTEKVQISGNLFLTTDSNKLIFGTGKDMSLYYDGTSGFIKTDEVGASDLHIVVGSAKTLVLDTSVWDDITGDPTSIKTVGANISVSSSEDALTMTTATDLNTYFYKNVEMPHSWKAGTVIYPHIHFWQTENNVPNFLLQYRWQSSNGTKTTSWTSLACNTPTYTYVSGTLNQTAKTTAGITPPAGYGMSDIIQFRVIRDNANTSTLFSGSDPFTTTVSIISFDIHFEKDTIGSRTMSTK